MSAVAENIQNEMQHDQILFTDSEAAKVAELID